MTKFESMDNMNTNFVVLSEQELIETAGGIAAAYATGYAIGRGLGYF